jgi:phospholipid-binding lipoprotein MlaA
MRFLLGALLLSSLLFSQGFDDEFAIEKKGDDVFKSYNVVMTNFNDTVYTYIFNPVAKGYADVFPEPIRTSVSNFFANIKFPISFINNLLQLKLENSFIELQRFMINSTIGIVGLRDAARDDFDMLAKKEDFGQTLGFYGFNDTPHIVLPFLGPSNVRDILGMGGDYFANPISYVENRGNLLANDDESTYTKIYDGINETSFNYKKYEAIKKDSIDLYLLLKNAYEQKRDKEIAE